jgi:hypothetical protein
MKAALMPAVAPAVTKSRRLSDVDALSLSLSVLESDFFDMEFLPRRQRRNASLMTLSA